MVFKAMDGDSARSLPLVAGTAKRASQAQDYSDVASGCKARAFWEVPSNSNMHSVFRDASIMA